MRPDIRQFMIAPDDGPDFRVEPNGGLALVRPLTGGAATWLRDFVAEGSGWIGDAVAVEMRRLPDLVDEIIAAGFLFEGDARPKP